MPFARMMQLLMSQNDDDEMMHFASMMYPSARRLGHLYWPFSLIRSLNLFHSHLTIRSLTVSLKMKSVNDYKIRILARFCYKQRKQKRKKNTLLSVVKLTKSGEI